MIDAIEKITNNYKTIINSGMFDNIIRQHEASIRELRKALDPIMTEMKNNAKMMAKRSLELGFYPSNQFSLYKTEFINLKNEEEIIYICKKIKELLTGEYIREISAFFNKSKIVDIYDDYCNKKYDDSILKMIVLINNIFNEKLDSTSSEEVNTIKRKFDNIVTGIELPNQDIQKEQNNIDWSSIKKIHEEDGFEKYAYYIFAPYYYSKKENKILINYHYNKKMTESEKIEKYKKIPYNRNAIIHGYVNFEEFGNEENCLRWFSVLINTYELFKLLEELSISE